MTTWESCRWRSGTFWCEGVFVNGAAQGYLIDKKTADQYKITNIAQLKDPKIAKLSIRRQR
ncbi:hypothetical protein ACLB1M_20810 [Escherichia coli]